VVLDTGDPWLARRGVPFLDERPGLLRRLADRFQRSTRWTKVFDEDGVLVFRRVAGG
jgi:hypothetical protein